jgi:hypothetical protein
MDRFNLEAGDDKCPHFAVVVSPVGIPSGGSWAEDGESYKKLKTV